MGMYDTQGTIEGDAYFVANAADDARQDIMSDIRTAVTGASNGTSDVYSIPALGGIDISTGAGALILDDTLQKLSNQEQASGQILSSKNRGQKEMNQLMR